VEEVAARRDDRWRPRGPGLLIGDPGGARGRAAASPDRAAVWAIVVGAGVRVVYGLLLHPPLHYVYSDMGGYVARAQRLASGHAVPRSDYFMPFGTQAVLSLPMRLLGTGRVGLWACAVLWCALSCLFPIAAWRWAQTVLSPRGAAVVAAGCALSPLAIIYGGYFSSELPAIVLLPTVLLLLDRAARRPAAIAAGVAAGATGVWLLAVRQQYALNIAVFALAVVLSPCGRAAAPALSRLAVGVLLGIIALVALGAPPWQVHGGLPPLFGQNGGVNFYYAHCDVHTLTLADLYFQSPVRIESRTGRDVRLPSRLSTDQGDLYRSGVECIARDPGRATVLAARSAADMTLTAIPFPPYLEGGVLMVVAECANTAFCILLGLLVVAALRVVRSDRTAAVLVAHLACALVVAVVYLGEPRYRVPYDLFGWALLGWWLTRRERARSTTPVRLPSRPG
jgi:hypothetical protein